MLEDGSPSLGTSLDPSAALLRDFYLLQASGEMLSIWMMKNVEMVF
ncbi:hypothetical protein KSF_089460 [Reticulibacter mediterranei]|uniref:Uncharacterized protein n=1 Tax=Reticulibacter mediterranei TaxID=2778369 RepID=A0A8J3IRD9_9CHLR|nr:hypothetical protein [Reticulibacter mediterranei]GHO98898.1 hypothetical protein KSF_089460 [Reticulibacter mediterranei]